jgi:hypothetical protein
MMSADGNWKAVVDSPAGKQDFTITIKTRGASFTGAMFNAMGSQDISGKIDGDTLTWSTQMEQPMPLTLDYSAVVSGDKLTGSVKAGAFGTMPIQGVRA